MRIMKINKGLLLLFLSGLFLTTGCEDDTEEIDTKETDTTEKHQFAHSVKVDKNTYLSTFKDLTVKETKTSNAHTHSGDAYLFSYNDWVFVLEAKNDRLFRYRKTDNDLIAEGKTLVLPAKSFASSICFISDSKAYISYTLLGKIAVLDLEKWEITKEIDITEFALGDQDINPEAVSMIYRDNHVFVALWQQKAMNIPHLGSYVLVINTTTDKPEKMLTDTRGIQLGSHDPSGSPFIDERGDIYFYATGAWGYVPQKDGFLRIRKGSTEFDPDYFFSISKSGIKGMDGYSANFLYQKIYSNNGVVYGFINIPELGSNPPDFLNDKSMQPCMIDVYNKTITKLNVKPTTGWSTCISQEDQKLILGMSTEDGTGYYIYDLNKQSNNGVSIVTEGIPFRLLHMN
ncbi:hypothetical protein DMA11_11715 [Marinilabiliaceae bacterium JC017]|nr:hypothetical protein DMA11_11715 [Marinilabiliaceae bacterium JC017]